MPKLRLTGSELLQLVQVVDGVLVFAKRGLYAKYQVGDAVATVEHNGRTYYRIGQHRYRPDILLAAVQAQDPSIYDAKHPTRPKSRARKDVDRARDARIAAMLQQGKTYAEVGVEFGISRQRVKQLADAIARTGVAANPRIARVQAKEAAIEQAHTALYGPNYHAVKNDPELLRYLKARIRAKRNHAHAQGISFDLTVSDMLPLPTHCPVLGIQLTYTNARGHTDTALSFDRIDPTKGYTKDNVVLVSQRANRIKNDATPQELQKVAEFYARYLSLDGGGKA